MAIRLRIAVIGAGVFVRDAHASCLEDSNSPFEVVATYSRSEEVARSLTQFSKIVDVYYGDQLGELLARPDIDAVDIVLPIAVQPSVIRRALAAGKHVISEKPVASTVKEGLELVREYEEKYADKLVWRVAENWRYEPNMRLAADAVGAGDVGKPILVTATYQFPVTTDNKYYKTEWRKKPVHQGGLLLDGGVHHIAALRMVLGEVKSAVAHTIQARPDLPPADTICASLHFDSGALCSYTSTYAPVHMYACPEIQHVHVTATEGSVSFSRAEVELKMTAERAAARKARVGGFPDESDKDGPVTESLPLAGTPTHSYHYPVQLELVAFAGAILTKLGRDDFPEARAMPDYNLPRQALQDVAVIEALLESARTGHRVDCQHVLT